MLIIDFKGRFCFCKKLVLKLLNLRKSWIKLCRKAKSILNDNQIFFNWIVPLRLRLSCGRRLASYPSYLLPARVRQVRPEVSIRRLPAATTTTNWPTPKSKTKPSRSCGPSAQSWRAGWHTFRIRPTTRRRRWKKSSKIWARFLAKTRFQLEFNFKHGG